MEGNRTISRPFKPIPLEVESVGKKLLDAAYTVHSALGPGLLESVYEACTAYEAEKLGLHVETQVAVPVKYQSVVIETGLRIDLWAERLVIVEFKTVEEMHTLYHAQLLTYLKVTGLSSWVSDELQREALERRDSAYRIVVASFVILCALRG